MSAATPVPDNPGKYHIGGGVAAPKLTYSAEPDFSKIARKKKISGNCLISLTVDTDGHPQDVHVVRSIAEGLDKKERAAAISLDEKAVAAVRQYRFDPATYQGMPVPVEMKVEVNFQIF